MPSATVKASGFIDLVRKSGLINEEELGRFERENRDEIDKGNAQTIAARMVHRKLLTKYQVKNLLAGKYKGFFLGPYRVLEPLGSGGMGIVYLAEHTELKRRVALKVLPSAKSKEKGMLDRFNREARAAALLDHPHIMRIFDIVHEGPLHFIVMEYVEGQTLHDLLVQNGPMAIDKVVAYISQTASGLHHAHSKGIVHRDIKPSNLILDKNGAVKILDMGLARSFEAEQDNLTKQLDENAIVGTADIISPEQAMSLPVDHRSDIYSLGVTMFMLAIGKPPFEGTTAQKLVKHQLSDAPSLSSIRKAIPAGLSQVVHRMMAKKPVDRYQSALEVIEALEPWLREGANLHIDSAAVSGGETLPGSPSRTLRVPKPGANREPAPSVATPSAPSRKRLYAIAAGGLLAVGAGLGIYFGTRGDSKPQGEPVRKGSDDAVAKVMPQEIPAPQENVPPKAATSNLPEGSLLLSAEKLADYSKKMVTDEGTEQDPKSPLPKPWGVGVWGKSTSGEAAVKELDGSRSIAYRLTRGSGIELHSNGPVMEVKPGVKYLFQFEYRTDGAGANPRLSLRKGPANIDRISDTRFDSSPGRWSLAQTEFQPTGNQSLHVAILYYGTTGEWLYIRKIECGPKPEAK